MRVLVLNWKDPADVDAGGAERYVQRIAELWAAQGHDVTLLVPRRGDHPASERRAGVTYLRVGNRLSVFRKAAAHLRACGAQYDRVVESISTLPFFSHEIVGERAIAIYLQMALDVWDVEYRFPVGFVGRRVLEPKWARRMVGAQVVALSESTRLDLADHGIGCLGIAPPGSDSPSPCHHRPLSGSPRLLFMGRLVRHKRPIDAVHAFLGIREDFPQAHLDVIGDGYLRSRVEALRAPATTVHGFVTEEAKRTLLDDADLLLLPATREGWGIVAVEAAAHGLPVVGYDVAGLRDSVSDGVTGILCAPRPDAMAEVAKAVLRDPPRWQALSDAGPSWAAQFTWERTAATIMDLLSVAG